MNRHKILGSAHVTCPCNGELTNIMFARVDNGDIYLIGKCRVCNNDFPVKLDDIVAELCGLPLSPKPNSVN